MVSIIESNGGGQGGVISERSKHLVRFYAAMDELERRLGGARILGQCAGRMTWPPRGVYFVREPGELRFDGRSPRIVLVGTHAIKNPNEKSQLRGRIRTHRGNRDGGWKSPGIEFSAMCWAGDLGARPSFLSQLGRRQDGRHCGAPFRRYVCRNSAGRAADRRESECRHLRDVDPLATDRRRPGSR